MKIPLLNDPPQVVIVILLDTKYGQEKQNNLKEMKSNIWSQNVKRWWKAQWPGIQEFSSLEKKTMQAFQT